ncbi:MAG: sugar ABC transporter substrate-binding protein [Phycisphaerales bacterium]
MNKKIILIVAIGLCVIIGAIALRAISGSIGSDAKTIVVVLPSDRNSFWIDVRSGAEEAAAALGAKYTVTITASSDQDATSQNAILDTIYTRQRADALVFGPANNHSTVPRIARFLRDGVPVVVVDTEMDAKAMEEHGVEVTSFIGSSNVDGGERAARAMASAIDKRDKTRRVLLIQGSFVHQSAIDRSIGFVSAAKELGLDVVEVRGEWRRDRAQELVVSHIARGEFGGIFASNDDMALGAIAGLQALNLARSEWPIVIGFDATQDARDAIAAGTMYASVEQDARRLGSEGVMRAVRALEEDPSLPQHELLSVKIVRDQ